MAFLKILFYLIVLIAVLMLAYYTTRMLGRGMGRTRGCLLYTSDAADE